MPAIVTPAAILVRFAGGGGVGVVDVLVGTVPVVEVSVGSVLVVVGGGGAESASAYAAAPPDTPRASSNARSAARFTAGV
jgi:hypothetical protein